MSNDTKTVLVFCAAEQTETPHSIDIDGNGEILLQCTVNHGTAEAPVPCNHFVKLPQGTKADDVKAWLATYKAANTGQISVASLEAQKAELIAGLTGPEASV